MTFFIRLAGLTVEIHSQHKKVYGMCQNYLTDNQTPDIVLKMSQDQIIAEATAENNVPVGSLESLAVYRKIAEAMLEFHVLLIHGAVVSVNGKAYLFTASSGIGKSTHIEKWINNIPDAFVVNGDKPLIIVKEQPIVCGTPWAGKEDWHVNTMVPLAAIVLMERCVNNEIKQISFTEAFVGLYRQTYHPKSSEKEKITLNLLKSLNHRVKFYRFRFNNMKDDAFQVSYHELVERQHE